MNSLDRRRPIRLLSQQQLKTAGNRPEQSFPQFPLFSTTLQQSRTRESPKGTTILEPSQGTPNSRRAAGDTWPAWRGAAVRPRVQFRPRRAPPQWPTWPPARATNLILADDGYGGHSALFPATSKELRKALRPNTKMVWFESPSNPLLKVVDIAAVSKIVKAHNSECLVLVDNTFMSPFFQNPLAFGADVVLHSLTKYINGHSDVVMGCLMTDSERLEAHFLFQQLAVGSVPSSFDVYLVLRGIKTLHLRMRQHHSNAISVARWLETDPRVERVLYPELKSHPQHEVHKKQTSGMSGMISFYLRTDLEGSRRFLANLKVFTLAESLGGYESLAELPSLMTHASVPPETRRTLGITDNLIRLSIGCEDKFDLISDLNNAMETATGESRRE
ncbi:hypothetical protein niasHT_008763 [Heterodera trifolii]|uniref:cystathionine gamma-lyase n=1 Tax=Heterodera trifolii TaxID=157864 RepID=A0ABD2M2D2_9BILA